jgi:16S rRNA (guanine527-N7)-methyltransferase
VNPPSAAAAARAFGVNADRATRYAELLASTGIERGLIGPREADRIWDRHIFNSAAVTPLIADAVSVVDVGSGAGLPGIPVALARPDLHVVLLEPMARRVQFLEECIAELGISNVTVRRGRAQEGLSQQVDVMLARAVAPLVALAEMAVLLCRADGTLLAIKGEKAADEASTLVAEGRFAAVVHRVTDADDAPATVVEVRWPAKNGRKAR